MKVTRIYADQRGDSRFEEEDITLSDAGEIGQLSEAIPATAVIFRTNAADYDYSWHTAPNRQFIALLDGAIEIEVSAPEGERRTFRGGDVLLVEDTFGRGHRTRNVEASERRSLFIILADQRSTSE